MPGAARSTVSEQAILSLREGEMWSTITVYGAAAGCGAVTVNYGDGDVVTYAIDGLPVSNYWRSGPTGPARQEAPPSLGSR